MSDEVKKYLLKNVFGSDAVFTVVTSDFVYNNITASNIQSIMPWNDIDVPLTYHTEIKPSTLRPLHAIGLSFNVHQYTAGSVVEQKNYYLNDDKWITLRYNNVGSSVSYFSDKTRNYKHSSNQLPIGGVGYDSQYFDFYILVCNSDMTLHKVVYINNFNNTINYSVSGVNPISYFNTSNYFSDIKPAVLPNPDPYTKGSGGHSGGGGGTGRFSRTGDTVGEHNVPTLSATDAGFITLFAPTAGEMKALASYLWSDIFSIDTFKKIFANPMDAILGLSIVPISVPTSGSASVKVGNISTGVSMTKASTQYVKLSCGSLEVEEYWGAYLDYSPYTKCEIYLPYIGVHELSVDDVMGKTVKVVYYIDILSGACTAEIYSNSTCLYSFVGQCSASIPITGNDWTNVINGVMQIGASIGSMVASGGLTAPISAGGVAQGLKSVASASSTVTSSKPSVERSGSMSGAGGMLGQQTPYLIITWPRECIPADQNKYIGYPSYVTVNLGDIVGFNIIESIHLENISATSAELDEIESMLMNGVIF